MTDATFQGWIAIERRCTLISGDVQEKYEFFQEDSDCIPDWAALAVALGLLLAVAGFVSAWFTDRGWATSALALGLIIAAIGMKAAENSVDQKSQWRPL
jgi:hypothetical protein